MRIGNKSLEAAEERKKDMGVTENFNGFPKEAAWKWRFYQHPDDPEGGAQKRYQWCINKETFEEIKNGGYRTAEVLIVLVDKEGYETRHMVHLSDMQAFVPIRKPGAYKEYATVFLSKSDMHWKDIRREYLSRSGARYHTLVFDRDEEKETGKKEIASYIRAFVQPIKFELIESETYVSAENFGAPPPAWVTWWVDFLHSEKTRDTCHFRRRLLYAIFGKPFIALGFVLLCIAAWLVVLAVSLVFVLLTGNRGLNWRWFLGPTFDETPFESFSKFSAITYGRNLMPRAAWRMRTFLIPWVQIVLASITYALTWLATSVGSAHTEFYSVWLYIYLGLAAFYIAWSGVWTLIELPPSLKRMRRNAEQDARDSAKRRLEQKEEEEAGLASFKMRYAPLVCDGSGKVAERPAFSLQNPRPAVIRWYQDAKATYCKQYPAS